MRMLNFTVEGQRLKKEGDFSGIRAGSVNYLKCQFRSGDEDWKRSKKAAVFNDIYPVSLDETQSCMVPEEVSGDRSFRVQLVGQNGKTRIVTNAVLIEQV
jgi:hypothetical protein